MLIVTKIHKQDLINYREEFLDCLNYNLNFNEIKRIAVFTDLFDNKIPTHPKLVVRYKVDLNDFDLIKFSKSDPFGKTIMFQIWNLKISSDFHKITEEELNNYVLCYKNSLWVYKNDIQIRNHSNTQSIFTKQIKNVNFQFDIIRLATINTSNVVIDNKPNVIVRKSQPGQKIEKKQRDKKLDVIIVSVNYNDYLLATLSHNINIFENITIVTSPDDLMCQEICKKFEVKCLITDIMYENGDKFNKGKAINFGISSIVNPDLILLLDSDIIVTEKIDLSNLDDDALYTSSRWICKTYQKLKEWQENKDFELFKRDNDKGWGFFQLFNKDLTPGDKPFPENSPNASMSDLMFRDKFPNRKSIELDVIHLGDPSVNWNGRKTSRFLKDDEFYEIFDNSFNINQYFDKIYCLNLDRRLDRWNKVNKQFSKLKINVERWSAIDGDAISDDLLNLYNPNNIKGEEASKKGIVENKNAIACLLSHIEIIKNAKYNNYERILIFEDDILFSKHFENKISKIKNIDWKLLYLGASQFDWSNINIDKDYYLCNKTLGTFAYAIDRSIFDEVIQVLENRKKSVDNSLAEVQSNNKKFSKTLFPNIVISDVFESDIRETKNQVEYAKITKWNLEDFETSEILKVLLLPDIPDWAFDNIAKSIVKYNPYPDKIKYEINYISDITNGQKINEDEWDYIFVFFEAERSIEPSKKIIRGCYSAFWLENSFFTAEKIGQYFNKCKASIYANETLRNKLLPNIKEKQPTVVITDSSDENIFYPINGLKEEKFTAIFVGKTERKIKNFEVIKSACKKADVELLVCRNVKNSELVNYYNKSDVCINFSDFEGGPQTFIESSLCEVPMIVRSNLDLSKKIPCFIADTEEELVSTLIRLKRNRLHCKAVGKKARIEALKNFTYKKTAEKFADFFLNIESNKYYYKKDLSNELTVYIISCGENPNYEDCKNSLENQSVKFNIKEIKNVSPMSAAFQKMIDECETDFYIQVDEDMILFEDSIEIIYNSLMKSDENICTVAYMLKDVHLDFNLYGIKGYKHNILKNYPYNLEIISCEVDQVKRLQDDGYDTLMTSKVIGYHSPKWTNEIIFERYFDLMEKWKNFKYVWLDELPSKLIDIFRNDPSDLNFYALMGAMTSLSSSEKIRQREKNFEIKDENYQRIKLMSEKRDYKFIKNNDIEESNILTKNLFGGDKKI